MSDNPITAIRIDNAHQETLRLFEFLSSRRLWRFQVRRYPSSDLQRGEACRVLAELAQLLNPWDVVERVLPVLAAEGAVFEGPLQGGSYHEGVWLWGREVMDDTRCALWDVDWCWRVNNEVDRSPSQSGNLHLNLPDHWRERSEAGPGSWDEIVRVLGEVPTVQRQKVSLELRSERINALRRMPSPAPSEIDLETVAIAMLLTLGPNANAIAEELRIPRTTLLGWPKFKRHYDQMRTQRLSA
jgi:hypothetical protein